MRASVSITVLLALFFGAMLLTPVPAQAGVDCTKPKFEDHPKCVPPPPPETGGRTATFRDCTGGGAYIGYIDPTGSNVCGSVISDDGIKSDGILLPEGSPYVDGQEEVKVRFQRHSFSLELSFPSLRGFFLDFGKCDSTLGICAPLLVCPARAASWQHTMLQKTLICADSKRVHPS